MNVMCDDILRYALFSRLAYYDDISEDEISAIGGPDLVNHTHTFIDCKDTQCWIFRDENELIVSFRGTDSLGDFLSNMDICPSPLKMTKPTDRVHTGYLKSYTSARTHVMCCIYSFIKTLHTQGRIGKITLCGHSLGGVCAALCALETVMSTQQKNVQCFTFGSPAVGNASFCDTLVTHVPQMYRIVHDMDFAPAVPLVFFKHHDTQSEIRIGPHIIEPSHSRSKLSMYIRNHSIESYIGILRRTNKSCIRQTRKFVP